MKIAIIFLLFFQATRINAKFFPKVYNAADKVASYSSLSLNAKSIYDMVTTAPSDTEITDVVKTLTDATKRIIPDVSLISVYFCPPVPLFLSLKNRVT